LIKAPAFSHWLRGLVMVPALLARAIIALIAIAMVYISLVSVPGVVGVLGAGLALVVLAIAISDWNNFIIPDWLNITGGILGLLQAAAQEPTAMVQAVALAAFRGLVLALIFLALRYGYGRYRGRQGLGLGDVKLAFVAGGWLDWLMLPIAIQLAVFATLTAYITRHIASGQPLSAASRMPFGLFLAPAIWVCWLLQSRWPTPF